MKANVGDVVAVYTTDETKRLAMGRIVKVLKNAVDIDCTESLGAVGPFGVKRFFYHEIKIA